MTLRAKGGGVSECVTPCSNDGIVTDLIGQNLSNVF